MDIGSPDAFQPADGAEMAERIRSAHESADEVDAQQSTSAAGETGRQTETVDEVGARLRASLESLVADVVAPGRSDPDDLIGRAVEAIVDDRIDHGELPAGEDIRREVADQLRGDPVVVGELEDIMQSIAREMARRDS